MTANALLLPSLLLALLLSCTESAAPPDHEAATESHTKAQPSQPAKVPHPLAHEFYAAEVFALEDTIRADFDGDGQEDWAVLAQTEASSGITIQPGGRDEAVSLGFGRPLAHLTDFDWVDYWGLVRDSSTYEILIEGSEVVGQRNVALPYPALVLRRKEAGGGVIAYRDGEYVWIHQAD